MAGIYLHIPFCKQACTYCNFHFTTSLRNKDDLITALIKEIEDEKHYLGGESIDTIYFGGGTPSLLEVADLALLISTIQKNYLVRSTAEITLEANPDDVSKDTLSWWKSTGFNRLSLGVQSFFDEELVWMNRAHNSSLAMESLVLAKNAFENMTMDLIYGSPLLSDEMWKKNVDIAISLGIPHLSCYALTVEEKTVLHKTISAKKGPAIDEDKQARQFLSLINWLGEAGYEHYEVSNFAKPGYKSRHNSSYWKGAKYLGIGPSAHSFDGQQRRWNVANNTLYSKGISNQEPQREVETLTAVQQLNETIMISLRTADGIDMNRLKNTWGDEELLRVESILKKYISKGQIQIRNQHAQLTDSGMLLADGIAADLFKI